MSIQVLEKRSRFFIAFLMLYICEVFEAPYTHLTFIFYYYPCHLVISERYKYSIKNVFTYPSADKFRSLPEDEFQSENLEKKSHERQGNF